MSTTRIRTSHAGSLPRTDRLVSANKARRNDADGLLLTASAGFDRIERFARLVGPENVIASTDCGLGGRIHPQIAWAKLESLTRGAELANARLQG